MQSVTFLLDRRKFKPLFFLLNRAAFQLLLDVSATTRCRPLYAALLIVMRKALMWFIFNGSLKSQPKRFFYARFMTPPVVHGEIEILLAE